MVQKQTRRLLDDPDLMSGGCEKINFVDRREAEMSVECSPGLATS